MNKLLSFLLISFLSLHGMQQNQDYYKHSHRVLTNGYEYLRLTRKLDSAVINIYKKNNNISGTIQIIDPLNPTEVDLCDYTATNLYNTYSSFIINSAKILNN